MLSVALFTLAFAGGWFFGWHAKRWNESDIWWDGYTEGTVAKNREDGLRTVEEDVERGSKTVS